MPERELPEHVRVAIVGSGFAGLGMAVRLGQEGIDDYVVLERGEDVGGTWRDNHYPGAACDVPSRLYSFSWAPNPDWTRSFSPQPEILAYLRRIADEFGIRPKLWTSARVESATWDEATAKWTVVSAVGTLTADVLVSAAGALSEPRAPEIEGIEDFAGPIFHSADWDHSQSLAGKKVAVIGTGASSIQIVPQLQPRVGELKVYQRTPAWIVPRNDRPFLGIEKRIARRFPAVQKLARDAIYWSRESYVVAFTRRTALLRAVEGIARTHLRRQVPDPVLREKLTPEYRIGCKRILISNDFYPALSKPNADVVTEPIERITAGAVVTADGVSHPTDALVLATGFEVTPPPVARMIRGTKGTLAEHWQQGGMQGHRGTAIAGFPNLFMLVGPNTGLGHTSMVYVIESQVEYVIDALKAMDAGGWAAVAPRQAAQDAFNVGMKQQLDGSVWKTGGCDSWYLDEYGNNTTLWPDFTFKFRKLTSEFDAENYNKVPA